MKLTRMTRTAGWLAVAGLLGAALIAPTSALATHVEPILIDAQGAQADCEDLGYDSGYKIEDFDDGVFGPAGFQVDIDWSDFEEGQPKTFDFEVVDGSALVNGVFVKAGTDGFLYDYGAGTDGDTGLVAPDGKQISHILVCYNEGTTTTSSTSSVDTVTTSSSTTSTSTTSTSSSTTSTSTTSSVDTVTTSTSTSGSISGETGESEPTPPSTDTIGDSGTGGTVNTWQLLLIGMAGLLATILLLTPAAAPRKR